MMSRLADPTVLDQALAWHLRLKDADEAAWLEFADWLEADPAHNAAYEAVVDEDERLDPLLDAAAFRPVADAVQAGPVQTDADGPLVLANDNATSRRWLLRWGALAASVAVAGFLTMQLLPGRDAYTLETPPGETRTITLADGSQIMLNGSSRIALDRKDERTAELLAGEAHFTVKHDAADPFTLTVGDSRVVDVGTVFNVVKTDTQLRVAVAEGAVWFEGATRKIALKPGDALSADGSGGVTIVRKPVTAIGSWAVGALVYDRTPLGVVSEDVSRSLGVSMNVPPAMVSQPFSGVIQTKGSKEQVRTRLEQLLNAPIVAEGSNWTVQQ